MQWIWPAILMLFTGTAHYFASAWYARAQLRRQAGERMAGTDRIARLVRFSCVFLPFGIGALLPDSWNTDPTDDKLWFFWWMALWSLSVLPGIVRYGSPVQRAKT